MREFWASQQWTAVGFLVVTTLIELGNWFILRRLDEFVALPRVPRVSVLVPARNEARTIERCIASLLAQDYPDSEVVVLDDGSDDGTDEILHRLAATGGRLRVLAGKPLPPGWIGKQWACQQLLEQATGEYVLYVDADTWHDPQAVRNGMAAMMQGNLDLLSAIPREVIGSFGELLVVPVAVWSLFALLPLWLAYHTKVPALASAIGQYMMFRTSSLRMVGGFERIRANAVDDLSMARLFKASGMRWHLVDGSNRVYCRMYEGFGRSVEGFSKNLYAVFYHNPLVLTLVWLVVLLVYTGPAAVLTAAAFGYAIPAEGVTTASGAIVLSVLQWGILTFRFRLPWALSFSWILGQPVAVAVAFRSLFVNVTRRATWKGRRIRSSQRLPRRETGQR